MAGVSRPNAVGPVPDALYSIKLPLPPAEHTVKVVPRHSAAYWTKVTAGQISPGVDPLTLSSALWRGLKGNEPYPTTTPSAERMASGSKLLAKGTRAISSGDFRLPRRAIGLSAAWRSTLATALVSSLYSLGGPRSI